MRTTEELHTLIQKRLNGENPRNYTLEKLFPDHKELDGFVDEQILAGIVNNGLRLPICVWNECYRVRQNGKWIEGSDLTARLAKIYFPQNQGICPICQEKEIKRYEGILSSENTKEI